MGTGYMGADEPAVAPKGSPEINPPSEQTLTNLNVEPKEPAAPAIVPDKPLPPAIDPKAAPVAKVEPPAVIEPPKADEPQVIEKIVEKIVEKHPEFKDEASKQLYDAWVEGRMDEVKAYWREMDKNYDVMSPLDIVREGLAKKHPQWSKDEIELELRADYGKQLEKYNLADFDKETDPDGYKEAQAHNELADANTLKLERDARDYRITLKEGQKAIELPKIKTEVPPVAEPAAGPTQEQIDEAARNWAEAAETQVKDLADFKFQVGDDKNPEEVVFAVTPEDKTAIIAKMKTWNGGDFMSRREWRNADGSFNLLNIAKDEQILIEHEKMVKSAYTQGVTQGRKAEVAKIKNVDLEQNRQPEIPAQPEDAGEKVWG